MLTVLLRTLLRICLRICLRAWPPSLRRRDGSALERDVMESLRDAPAGVSRWWWVVGELSAVVKEGATFRWHAARGQTREVGMGVLGDVRFALRAMFRRPGFALAAVVTLSLGVGANTAVFRVVDQVLLQPPPYRDADRLVLIWNTLEGSPRPVPMVAPDVAVLRERARGFQGIGFMARPVDGGLESRDGVAATHVRVAAVTSGFFDVLGVDPAAGRTFSREDRAPSGDSTGLPPREAVLSHQVWQTAFGGDASVLGTTVPLNGTPVTVVGVLPEDFALRLPPDAGVATDVDVWLRLGTSLSAFRRPPGRRVDRDSDNSGAVVGRLAPTGTLAFATSEAERVAAELRSDVPAYREAGLGTVVRPLHADATRHLRPLLVLLVVGVVLALLVACANLGTLMAARGLHREGELAVRTALGASRARILRHLLVEALLLVGVGLVGGVVVAGWVGRGLIALAPDPSVAPAPGPPSGQVLLFAGCVAVLVGGLVGVVPSLQVTRLEARGLLAASLRRRGGRLGGRHALAVGQVALSVLLTFGAVQVLRAVDGLQRVDPGFDPAGALTFNVSVRTPGRYPGPGDRARLMAEITRRLTDVPAVEAVGLTGHLPLSGRVWTQPYGIPGQPREAWERNRADFRSVTSGYFAALGARLVEGRTFTAREDLHEDQRVVVVDRALARRLAQGTSAVGRFVSFPLDGDDVTAEVIGVVDPIRHDGLEGAGREGLYVPYRQEASRDVSFVVRTSADPASLAPAVRQVLADVDPQLPVYGLNPLQDYVSAALAPRRFALWILAAFAILALLSAGLGLYGVVALEVGRRTRTLGLRMALGASRQRVIRSVLWLGVRLGVAGTALGAALSLLLWRGAEATLAGLPRPGVATWLTVTAVVLGVTVAACGFPAARAGRLEPADALRES